MEYKDGKRFITVDEVETLVFPWGDINLLSEPQVTGTDNITAGVVTLKPGMGHERHNHEGCEELLYVLNGTGEQMVENEEGEQMFRIVKAGDMIHIPPGGFHSTINKGKKHMQLLAIYQFPEAVEEFRKLPEVTIKPPKIK